MILCIPPKIVCFALKSHITTRNTRFLTTVIYADSGMMATVRHRLTLVRSMKHSLMPCLQNICNKLYPPSKASTSEGVVLVITAWRTKHLAFALVYRYLKYSDFVKITKKYYAHRKK